MQRKNTTRSFRIRTISLEVSAAMNAADQYEKSSIYFGNGIFRCVF